MSLDNECLFYPDRPALGAPTFVPRLVLDAIKPEDIPEAIAYLAGREGSGCEVREEWRDVPRLPNGKAWAERWFGEEVVGPGGLRLIERTLITTPAKPVPSTGSEA